MAGKVLILLPAEHFLSHVFKRCSDAIDSAPFPQFQTRMILLYDLQHLSVPLCKKMDQMLCPQSPPYSLIQGAGEEDTTDSRTSDSVGTMWVPSKSQITGPAPHCLSGARGFHGSSPNQSTSALWIWKGIPSCSSMHLVGVSSRCVGYGAL